MTTTRLSCLLALALSCAAASPAPAQDYPARPIRIIVDGGHVSLYGEVISPMDKQIAGMRVGQIPGVFSVQNNLVVEKN